MNNIKTILYGIALLLAGLICVMISILFQNMWLSIFGVVVGILGIIYATVGYKANDTK